MDRIDYGIVNGFCLVAVSRMQSITPLKKRQSWSIFLHISLIFCRNGQIVQIQLKSTLEETTQLINMKLYRLVWLVLFIYIGYKGIGCIASIT